MAQIVAVVNQKGGVGKTTTAVNLTAALAAKGRRVLLCDLDPQGNATSGLGADKRTLTATVYDALLGEATADDVILHTPHGDLLPSNSSLAGAAVELVGAEDRNFVLRRLLDSVRDRYDDILIDCPPSLEMLTVNALCAADQVLVPVQCEYYALEGLSDLMSTMRAVKAKLNPSLSLRGVVLTMYDGRLHLSAQVAEEVRRHFPGKVFTAVVPRNVRLSEAPSHGLPVIAYDKFSRGAESYRAMAEEWIR
ncbi:MAG: ParA family protein [Oscillospiraceae bacterium]|nr:ParA family protein [Oscillospiraceae bacterium]